MTPATGVSTYDLLKAAARGMVGIDQRFMHALVDDPARSVPDMLRFALEDHENDPVWLEADLVAAFRHLKTPEALSFYLKRLREDGEDADDELINAVIEQGASAVDPLLALYNEMEEDESGDVGFILAALGVRDERILRLLLDRLEYDPADAAMSLGVYGDPAAIPELERVIASLPAESGSLRQELSEAIQDLQNPTGAAQHTHETQDLFSRYSEEAGPDFDALDEPDRLTLLGSDSPRTRADAARSFFQSEYDAAVRARLLEVARTDAVAEVRGQAWQALSGEDDAAIRQALFEAALDPSRPFEERGGALIALAADADERPELRAAIEALYDEPGARALALEAMWRSFDRTYSKYFPPHLEDSDRAVRVQAIFGTGYLGIGAEAERVAKYFDDDGLRPDALFAYALCVPAQISRGRIHGLFRKIQRVAGGLNLGESALVQAALDQRLLLHGLEPVFAPEEAGDDHVHGPGCGHEHASGEEWDEREEPSLAIGPAAPAKVGRNDPCPCGSGRKYKKCCGA